MTKQEFVFRCGDRPAKKIVQMAEARGIKLSVAYVYNARSVLRRDGGGGGARKRRLGGRPPGHTTALGMELDRLASDLVDGLLDVLCSASLDEVRDA